jgi:hypothetical protein
LSILRLTPEVARSTRTSHSTRMPSLGVVMTHPCTVCPTSLLDRGWGRSRDGSPFGCAGDLTTRAGWPRCGEPVLRTPPKSVRFTGTPCGAAHRPARSERLRRAVRRLERTRGASARGEAADVLDDRTLPIRSSSA